MKIDFRRCWRGKTSDSDVRCVLNGLKNFTYYVCYVHPLRKYVLTICIRSENLDHICVFECVQLCFIRYSLFYHLHSSRPLSRNHLFYLISTQTSHISTPLFVLLLGVFTLPYLLPLLLIFTPLFATAVPLPIPTTSTNSVVGSMYGCTLFLAIVLCSKA